MEKKETNNNQFLTKTFNILTDTGVQFSAGNTCLFWAGGGIPQIASTGALIGCITLKAYSEFSGDAHNLLADPNAALKIASGALGIIAVNSVINGEMIPAITSTAFAIGNLRVAGIFENLKSKLSDTFGKVVGQIATQPETFYTIGLGLAAHMAAGDATVALPFIDKTVPLSMLTYIPTAIGGGLAVRNAVTGEHDKSKPFLWLAGGVGATAGAGILGGAVLPALANGFFSSAYIKIQADIEGGYKNLGQSIKNNGQKLWQRIL